MHNTDVTAHVMVKNEEKWVWFAINSVLPFVDKMIIFDTGSTDETVSIIKEIVLNNEFAHKIHFEEKGVVDKIQFTKLRQEQLDLTDTKWVLILDGDEIWYEKDLILALDVVKTTAFKMLAVKFHNCTKDVYHYSYYENGGYNIKGEIGNITIKFISTEIEGLHADGPYGSEGFYDNSGKTIQENKDAILIIDGCFLHTSNLVRSKNLFHDWKIAYRRSKVFTKPDAKISNDFSFPEAFYLSRPKNISNPFLKAGLNYYFYRSLTNPITFMRWIKSKVK